MLPATPLPYKTGLRGIEPSYLSAVLETAVLPLHQRPMLFIFFMTQKRRLHSRFYVPLCKRRLFAILIDMRHIWFKSYPANDDVHDKETGSSDSATS